MESGDIGIRGPVVAKNPYLGPRYRVKGPWNEVEGAVLRAQNENANQLSIARRNYKAAVLEFKDKLPWHVSPDFRISSVVSQAKGRGVVPWMLQLDSSHLLYHCGGLVFCSKCGGVMSGSKVNHTLLKACGTKDLARGSHSVLKEGSKYRVQKLMEGELKGSTFHDQVLKSWPDGTHRDEVLVPIRFKTLTRLQERKRAYDVACSSALPPYCVGVVSPQPLLVGFSDTPWGSSNSLGPFLATLAPGPSVDLANPP